MIDRRDFGQSKHNPKFPSCFSDIDAIPTCEPNFNGREMPTFIQPVQKLGSQPDKFLQPANLTLQHIFGCLEQQVVVCKRRRRTHREETRTESKSLSEQRQLSLR